MKHIGYVEIKDNEVIFVYHELGKPDLKNYIKRIGSFGEIDYVKNLKKYEASKRSVKVGNVFWNKLTKVWIFTGTHLIEGIKLTRGGVEDNQPCEAEVKNGKAEITKIL